MSDFDAEKWLRREATLSNYKTDEKYLLKRADELAAAKERK